VKGTWEGERDPLAALRRGEPALFEAFVEREAATLIGFFGRLGAARDEAEDLAQDVFLKLYRHADTYEPRSAFTAFALRVARNAWIDRRRRRAALPPTRSMHAPEYGEGEGLEADLAADPSVEGGADPGRRSVLRDEGFALARALRTLSPNHALIFELAVVQRRPYAEIASELGIPVGTVKSRVFNALRRLRGLLEEGDPRS
jgi:RNA polymerase sigma-70 factor (ECF subfamily)